MTAASARHSMRVLALAFVLLVSAPASAFDIAAKLEREGSSLSGPSERACTFCPNKSTSVSTHFFGGFPPSASEIGGSARVDLATGAMRGDAHAVSTEYRVRHSIRFVASLEEGIDVTLPAGLPAEERFVTFVGAVHATATSTNAAQASAIYSLQVNNARAAAALSDNDGWSLLDGATDSRITATPSSNGYRFSLRLPIPTSGEFFIDSQLEGTAWAEGRTDLGSGIANVNASHTALLSMILPAGATYTSFSEVFLTSPIPEPHAWAMMLAGIGLLGLLRKRR